VRPTKNLEIGTAALHAVEFDAGPSLGCPNNYGLISSRTMRLFFSTFCMKIDLAGV
jgi:hypothetical protein